MTSSDSGLGSSAATRPSIFVPTVVPADTPAVDYGVGTTVAARSDTFDSVSTVYDTAPFDIRVFGATGDGVTDDTTAINSAFTAASSAGGGIVDFPFGTYLVSSALLPPSNVLIRGVGNGTQIKPATGSSCNCFTLSGVSHITITNLQINGNKANVNQAGAGATYTTKQGIYITGGSDDITIYNCYLHDCFAGAVLADNATNLKIYGNRCDANGDNAIFMRPGPKTPWTAPSNVTIASNIVSNGTYSGIGIIKTSNFTCSNNVCSSCGPKSGQGSGITIEGASYGTVAGNDCHDNGVNGIDLRYSDEGSGANIAATHIAVTGNSCCNNGYSSGYGNAGGIVTEGCDDVAIQGNSCYANYEGINISAGNGLDPSHVYVSGNVCRANADAGIKLYSAATAIDIICEGNYVADNLADQIVTSCQCIIRGGLIARGPTGGKEHIHLTNTASGSSNSVIDGVHMVAPIDNCILVGASVSNVTIMGCFCDKASGSGGRALYEQANGGPTTIENCHFQNFTFQSFYFNNASSIARNSNISQAGFYTQSSGTASIPSGGASVNVTHNLWTTPARALISPTTDPGSGVRIYVSAKGATTFTVLASSAGSVTFDWYAQTWDN